MIVRLPDRKTLLTAMLLVLLPGLLGAGVPGIRFLSPLQGPPRTFMPVSITLDFEASADEGTLQVLLNGSDIHADPAGAANMLVDLGCPAGRVAFRQFGQHLRIRIAHVRTSPTRSPVRL